MEYTQLGRTGLMVSRLCLGTMNFGPRTEEPDAYKIMDESLAQGINFFDTANVYGGELGKGITEQIVGRWLAQGASRRESIVLATKVYGRMGDGPNDRRLSAYHIRQACEASLRRLQTDHIDLYQMHHIDRQTPWEEIWQAMEQLHREGKVLYIGSSNFAGWQIAKAQELARQRNFLGLVSEQSLYNLNERSVELEVLPACEAYGLGLIPWSPLDGGLLAGVLNGEEGERRKSEQIQKEAKSKRSELQQYEDFCASLAESPADVALAWLLHQPLVTAPIIGPRTMEQLQGNIHASNIKLNEESLQRLDQIFPGPGGPAPEAYAW